MMLKLACYVEELLSWMMCRANLSCMMLRMLLMTERECVCLCGLLVDCLCQAWADAGDMLTGKVQRPSTVSTSCLLP